MFAQADASQFHQPFLPNNNVQADNSCSSKPDSVPQHAHNTSKDPYSEPGIAAKDPFIISFVPALHVSQPASSNWDYQHRLVSTTSNRRMLDVSLLPISRLKLVGTFAGLGLNHQIAWACSQLLHAELVAEHEEYPSNSQMDFSLLGPSLCERTANPMVFHKCPTSTACVCRMPMPSTTSSPQPRNFA